MAQSVKDTALAYQRKGKSCLPVGKDKRPLVEWIKYQAEVPSAATIEGWFATWPDANLAIPTGKLNGFVVIDCDNEEANAFFLSHYPEAGGTYAVKTPRGYHYYFKYAEGVRNDAGRKIGPGIDVRGDGGYVLVPPSVNAEGKAYSPWCRLATAELPERLLEILTKQAEHQEEGPRVQGEIVFAEGGRNNQLHRMASASRGSGGSYETVLAYIRAINEKQCIPPLLDRELEQIAKSVCARYEPEAEKLPQQQQTLQSHDLLVRRMDKVERRYTRWLWHGRIPLGQITMFEGDGGVGKSWLALAIASHISTGAPLPGDPGARRPGNILLMSAEDSPEEVILGKLEDQGADLSKVHFVDSVMLTGGQQRPITLEDMDRLELLTAEVKPDLIVIDPVVAFLGSKDMIRAQDVRSLMAPLHKIAEQHKLAVVLIRHLNKKSDTSAIYRGQGSQDFFSACRSVFHVIPDWKEQDKRHMVHTKSNRGVKARTQEFLIAENKIAFGAQNSHEAEYIYRMVTEMRNADRDKEESHQGRDDDSVTSAF